MALVSCPHASSKGGCDWPREGFRLRGPCGKTDIRAFSAFEAVGRLKESARDTDDDDGHLKESTRDTDDDDGHLKESTCNTYIR